MPFRTLNLNPHLVRAIDDLGFEAPTPIQAEAIPAALTGRDVLACAQTGSGKTAAFLLPILHRLMERKTRATRALVLVPTRELAAQVRDDLRDLAKYTGLGGAAVYGGVGHKPQERAFRDQVDILIATPGRLLEHLRAPYARLDRLEILVLDEADRMLDMGFLPDIRRVLAKLPAVRQTLCFSATMPPEIRKLTAEIQRDPVNIQRERVAAPPKAITQAVYQVGGELKSQLLVALLERGVMRQALVFTRTKHRANRLAELLGRHGIHAGRIHGNRSQAQRIQALQDFKDGRCPVLVATDIVARGIDVEQLGHVVNFDVPLVPEDYIHRVGRTGRAQASGEAITLVALDERGALAAIERALGHRIERLTLEGFDYAARPEGRLEIPLAQRIAEIRARNAEARARGERRRQDGAARTAGGHGARAGGGDARRGRPSGARPGGDASPGQDRRGAWRPRRPAHRGGRPQGSKAGSRS